MKKVLSVILAIMMIATVVPMAFAAEECEHVFNEETLVRPSFVDNTYVPGSFVCSECGETVEADLADINDLINAYAVVFEFMGTYYYQGEADTLVDEYAQGFMEVLYAEYQNVPVYYLTEYEQDVLDEIVEKLNVIAFQLDAFTKENGYEMIFDLWPAALWSVREKVIVNRPYVSQDISADVTLRESVIEEFSKVSEEITDRLPELYDQLLNYESMADVPKEIIKEIERLNNAEAVLSNACYDCCYLNKHTIENYVDCGDGTHKGDCSFCVTEGITEAHTWGEYTENADGTKTANCISCEATDTIVPENPDDDEDIDTPETPDNDENTEEEIPFDELSLYEKLVDIIKNFIELLREFLESIFA